jgi:hypothetical protein
MAILPGSFKQSGREDCFTQRFPALIATSYVSGPEKSRAPVYFFYQKISMYYVINWAAPPFL